MIAKDALGDDVTFKGWLDTHPVGDRKLVQGMKGDATYLIVKEDKTLEVTPPCIARIHCCHGGTVNLYHQSYQQSY